MDLMKMPSNVGLLLWFKCNQMNIKVVIFIKYGPNTIVIFQNFVDTSGLQKLTWPKFLEFENFLI